MFAPSGCPAATGWRSQAPEGARQRPDHVGGSDRRFGRAVRAAAAYLHGLAARLAWSSLRASTLAGSVPSSRASSPACGVISVGADSLARGSRPAVWLTMVSPSASTSTGTSVASTAASRAAACWSVPMPGPAAQAWTRPAESGSQSPPSAWTVSTASGHACRTAVAGTAAVATRTIPAPPRTAPPVASTAAPANRSLPASRPSTPRRYLSDSGPGRGSRSPMSSRCGAMAPGSSFRYGRRPISTSSTVPACPAPGSISRPGLIAPNVTVTSARTAGPSTAPVSASVPLGRSTATTVGPAGRRLSGAPDLACSVRRARPAKGSRRPPRPPMPSRPSMIRSARAITPPASRRRPSSPGSQGPPGSPGPPASRPPAARSPARPPSWTFGPAAIAVTAAPRRASSAPAYRASPPLSPLPASTTTRAP